jgi:sugar lactone lactonase YvrE
MIRPRRTLAALAVLAVGFSASLAPPSTALSTAPSTALAPPSEGRAAQQAYRIALPDGWRPEGVTTDGKALYVGSLATGALWKVDPRTGKGRVLAPGAEGRIAVGIDYDRRRGLVWVAGGDTEVVRAHDARTGQVRATYSFPSADGRFVNDVVATARGVYATDSLNQELLVVPLRVGGPLPPPAAATTLPLTGDLVYTDGFNLNGIVARGGRLLAVQSNTGLLFDIGPATGRTRTVDLHGYALTNGDGLEIRGRTLFVVRNRDERVAVVTLSRDGRSGEVVAELMRRGFDVPTTVARVGQRLWAVNARFGTTPTPQTAYWLSRLDLRL